MAHTSRQQSPKQPQFSFYCEDPMHGGYSRLAIVSSHGLASIIGKQLERLYLAVWFKQGEGPQHMPVADGIQEWSRRTA